VTMANIRRGSASSSKSLDAVALLKADHRQVEQWFSQLENADSASKKRKRPDKASCFSSKLPKRYRPEDALG